MYATSLKHTTESSHWHTGPGVSFVMKSERYGTRAVLGPLCVFEMQASAFGDVFPLAAGLAGRLAGWFACQ